MASSCPKPEYRPMDPQIGGRTLFGCDGKECTPYKIEINPLSSLYAVVDYFNKMDESSKKGNIEEFLDKYGSLGEYVNNFENYVLAHETIHYKSLKENPEKPINLMNKYGGAWESIEEGLTEKKTIEQGHKIGKDWEEISPYQREINLAKNLASQDNDVRKYLNEDHNVASCLN